MSWKFSRYTHSIPLSDGRGLLYNGRSGALIELSTETCRKMQDLLLSRDEPLPQSFPHGRFLPHLAAGGFIVRECLDEVAGLEEQYNRERQRSQFLLTILPTFGCNLGCEYCFVGKKTGIMNSSTQQRLVAFVANHLKRHRVPSMNVDWFGGEPLLALPVIEHLSCEFLQLCESHKIPYRAQVITNGSTITPESVRTMEMGRVDRLQITVDGLADIHDERRPYKAGKKSSFQRILDGLPLVLGKFLIRLRINVDQRNLHLVWPLLDLFAQRGWLGPETRFFPYLARISPFTDACSSVGAFVCSMDEFYRVQFRWMERLEELRVPVSAQGLYQFPEPKLYNCGAVGANGFVFTPEGEIHKCGLTVDSSREAIGHLNHQSEGATSNLAKWQNYSPFRNSVCRDCEFLPTCLGGCPRNQMESRTVQVKENCTFHKTFERQVMLFHLGHRDDIEKASEDELHPSPKPVTHFPILHFA